MRVLTFQQPWGTAVVRGEKPIENRPNGMGLEPGEWVGAHAGLKWHKLADWCRELWPACPGPEEAPRGVLLGLFQVEEILTLDEVRRRYPELARWAIGPTCIRIGRAIELPAEEQVRATGHLWAWKAEGQVLATLRRALARELAAGV